MELTNNQKIIGVAVAAFAIAVTSNIAAQAIYARNKLGADKKTLLLTSAMGVGVGVLAMKYFKLK